MNALETQVRARVDRLLQDSQQTKEIWRELKSEVSWTSREHFEQTLKTFFSRFFAPELVEERFAIPDDYAAFLAVLQGSLVCNDYWAYFSDFEGVLTNTKFGCETFFESLLDRRLENESYFDDTFWIAVGGWSDKHEYVLCCDKTHPDFGKIFDGHDDFPWLSEDFSRNNRKVGTIEELLNSDGV